MTQSTKSRTIKRSRAETEAVLSQSY